MAIYRWRVAPEHEQRFAAVWRDVTLAGREAGSFGSLLGRTPDGVLVAVALWPIREARDQAFAGTQSRTDWSPAERLGEEQVTPLDDLWTRSPFG